MEYVTSSYYILWKCISCLAVSLRAIVGHKVTDRNNSLLILCVHGIVTIHVSVREAKFHTHTTARHTFQQPHILTTVPAGVSTKKCLWLLFLWVCSEPCQIHTGA